VKPVRFEYERPIDLATALSLGGREDIVVKFLAGGQSLGPMLNLRLVQPDLLVDLTGIAELKRVEETAESITIGSCVTHADIEDGRVPDVTRGALRAVAAGIAYRAVRNRGTIGGSIVHSDPSADWLSALAALGAAAIVRGVNGDRRIPIETFMLGVFESSLKPGEVVTAIHVPRLSQSARWGYYKACRKTGEFAHAIGAFLRDPGRSVCRAVIGATGARPIILTDGEGLVTPSHGAEAAIDVEFVRKTMRARGPTDPIDQQVHIAVLRRAIAQADGS
jgi:aerobic carbon-monoxide dehydrogenase medium subunit